MKINLEIKTSKKLDQLMIEASNYDLKPEMCFVELEYVEDTGYGEDIVRFFTEIKHKRVYKTWFPCPSTVFISGGLDEIMESIKDAIENHKTRKLEKMDMEINFIKMNLEYKMEQRRLTAETLNLEGD